MKFKKCIALCLVIVTLFSLSSCTKNIDNPYLMFKEKINANTFNTVVDLSFSTITKTESNDDISNSYRIYIDADTCRNNDTGRLYAKHSINEKPYQQIFEYIRQEQNLYYNVDNYIDFKISQLENPNKTIDSVKNNLGIKTQYGKLNTSDFVFRTFKNNNKTSVVNNLFRVIDLLGEDFFDFLVNEKILVKNNDTLFSEINLNSDNLVDVVNYLSDYYNKHNGIKDLLQGIIEESSNDTLKLKTENEEYLMLINIDMFFNMWDALSKKEQKELVYSSLSKDFNLKISIDNTDLSILKLEITGFYSSETSVTRFDGFIKFRNADDFTISVPDNLASENTIDSINLIFKDDNDNG